MINNFVHPIVEFSHHFTSHIFQQRPQINNRFNFQIQNKVNGNIEEAESVFQQFPTVSKNKFEQENNELFLQDVSELLSDIDYEGSPYGQLPDDITAQKFVFEYSDMLTNILFDYYMDQDHERNQLEFELFDRPVPLTPEEETQIINEMMEKNKNQKIEIDLEDAKLFIEDMTDRKFQFTSKNKKRIDEQIMRVWENVKEGFESTHLDLNEDFQVSKKEAESIDLDQIASETYQKILKQQVVDMDIDSALQGYLREKRLLTKVYRNKKLRQEVIDKINMMFEEDKAQDQSEKVDPKIGYKPISLIKRDAKMINFSEKPVQYYGDVIKPLSCGIAAHLLEMGNQMPPLATIEKESREFLKSKRILTLVGSNKKVFSLLTQSVQRFLELGPEQINAGSLPNVKKVEVGSELDEILKKYWSQDY